MTDSGPSHNKDSGYIGDDGLGKEVHQSRFPLRTLRPRHNLPPTSTSFVGRENELRIILKQLGERDCRLLTLVGMGGIGKTRLALVAAEQLVDAFEHGVFFVSLAPLRSPNDIVPSIAGALHVPLEASGGSDRQQLLDYLDERELLLVLDNLEHLLDDVTLVDALLSGAPRVKVLATSREPLNLGWECLFEVGGLEMPATGEDDDAETFAAVRLFVERAVRVQPSFKLAGEYVSVIEIIRRVGGVPLGIEIAAGWLRLMPPEAIAENLLDLETARRDVPERQRSLRALFDQTWTRLSGEEQEVIGRLSVFPGSFAHDAAYAVSRATPPLLANLVARSLVQYQAENHRYQLHELLREYAEERLTELPEARLNALDRHADHYARLIEDQQEQIAMGHVGLVAPEMDNIRAAWEWALDRRNVPVLYRAVRSLLQTYQSNFHSDAIFASGALEDSRRPFERAVAVLRALPSGRERDLALGQCLVGVAAGTRGPERQKMYEEGLSLLRRHGPSPELAYAGLWVTTSAGGRFPVEENLRESLAIYSELGSKWGMCVCLLSLIFARLARVQVWPFDADTLDRVTDMCQQALTLAREMGSDVNMVWGLARMSWIEEAKGNYRGSLACIQQAISLCRQNGYVILAAQEQLDLVYFAIGAEEFDLAERVAEEACAFFRALGSPFFLRRARIRLAEIKYRLAKYVAARNYLEIVFAQAGLSNLPTEIDGRVALGYVALAQIANSEALNHFLAALRLGVGQAPDLFRIPEALLGIAYVWYRRGIVTQALDLLAVLAHCRLGPTYTPEWLRLQDTLEAELGPNAVADAIERGKDRGLLEIAREVLAELTEKRSTGEIGAPALEHKLLSERELEVLALVAAGKSNRQIATELYLALGTVKTHIHNVCEKLDAQSRTEAVAIARQMNLL